MKVEGMTKRGWIIVITFGILVYGITGLTILLTKVL